jgi:hypothetical protein
MALRETEIEQTSSNISADELDYRLKQTREYQEFSKRKEPPAGMRMSISEVEIAKPYMDAKLGLDVELPTPQYGPETTVASVRGTALHQAVPLFRGILNRKNPKDAKRMLPSTKENKIKPYQETMEIFRLKPDATPEDAETLLYEAWELFHKNPTLVDQPLMEPLFKNIMRDWPLELEIRKSPEVVEAGRKLAKAEVKKYFDAIENSTTTPREQHEVQVVVNLCCGIQMTMRLDTVGVHFKNGQSVCQIEDLKTGKRPVGDEPVAVHKFQSGLMITLGEKFSYANLGKGHLRRSGKAYILFGVDHSDPNGQESAYLVYKWFNAKTGEVTEENIQIEDRFELNRQIDVFGKFIQVFKPYLKEYLDSKTDRQSAGERETPKKKIIKPHPDGLVQQELNFYSKAPDPVQEEFEEIAEEINAVNSKKEPLHVGFVGEPIGYCDCGSPIGNFYKYIGGKGTGMLSRVVVSEKCMGCGTVYKKNPPKRVTSR